jgi:hypothetical protein
LLLSGTLSQKTKIKTKTQTTTTLKNKRGRKLSQIINFSKLEKRSKIKHKASKRKETIKISRNK